MNEYADRIKAMEDKLWIRIRDLEHELRVAHNWWRATAAACIISLLALAFVWNLWMRTTC